MAHRPDEPDFMTTPEDEPRLPTALHEALRETHSAERAPGDGEAGVETRVDEAVMSAARERLAEVKPPAPYRFPYWARALGGATAAAAAVALVITFAPRGAMAPPPQQQPGATSNRAQRTPSDETMESMELAEAPRAGQLARLRPGDAPDALASRAEAERETRELRALSLADASARPTIRDAYVLALALERGGASDERWDANGDGVVNDLDVETLARRAVELDDSDVGMGLIAPTIGTWMPFALFVTGEVTP